MAPKPTPTQNSTKKTIRRARKRGVEDLIDVEKYSLISDYKTGTYNFGQLTDKYQLRNKRAVEDYINKIIQELNIVKETNALDPSTLDYHQAYRPSNLINEPFLELLSAPEGELTDNEHSYIYLLVFTGDHKKAFEDSGLIAGLKKYKSHETAAYASAIRVRGLYVRQKANVKREYNRLREVKLKELSKDIDKGWIVNELIDHLERLKESGEHPKLILDTIDKIGKTCGAFVERIEVQDISAAGKMSYLDNLIEMTKQEVVPQLPHDSGLDIEVFEADEA